MFSRLNPIVRSLGSTFKPTRTASRFYKTDINNTKIGAVIEREGKPFIVMGKDHGGTGRGQAVIKITLKDPVSGQKSNIRVKGGESVEVMKLNQREYQYLYTEGKDAHLMNMETYEELTLPLDSLEGGKSSTLFLQDGMNVTVQILEPDFGPISWRLPNRQVYTVETVVRRQLMAKGTTFIPAIVNGGAEIRVPDFVNPGDKVIVDTTSHEYISRAN